MTHFLALGNSIVITRVPFMNVQSEAHIDVERAYMWLEQTVGSGGIYLAASSGSIYPDTLPLDSG
jgi:hypothetical protein